MRFRTWPVAALGLGSLLVLIVVSMLTLSHRAQEIYAELDQLNTHHSKVDTDLRRLRSDVNLSGIFVRDYLLDIARERAPEYRDRLAQFRQSNVATLVELRALAQPHAERIDKLETQLDVYWRTFEPLFDWTASEKILRSANFLRSEVVPRREAVLAIAQEIEELNNANLAAQREEVDRRQMGFRTDLRRLLWRALLLGIAVAIAAVARLYFLERRADEQRAAAEGAEHQMRQLSQRLVDTQEEERKDLSRELHDHVAQVLTALRMELGRIERARVLTDAGVAAAECRALVDSLFRTVRDLALGLRPSMLDDLGLQPALEWHVRDFTRRYGLNVDLRMAGEFDALPDRYRTCLYRAVQEALTNCVRHAKAQSVQVTVVGNINGVDLSVADDGVGLDLRQPRNGLGIRGIEERVRELTGTMTIAGSTGAGTTLSIHLPRPTPAPNMSLAPVAG
jgi:signal transduction histidine kinase